MQKEMKTLSFVLLGLLVTSFLIGVVSAGPLDDAISKAFSGSSGLFNLSSSAQDGLARILLIALVVMLVYSVITFLPFFPKNETISWVVSIIVGILSFMFVNIADIKTLMANYEALGIALTSILPLIIIIVFTYKLREKEAGIASIVNPTIIILFSIYAVIRWFTAASGSDLKWIYLITLIAAIIWAFIEKWVYFKMFKQVLKGEVSEANSTYTAHLTARMTKILELLDTAGPETKAKLEKEYDDLQKKLDSAKSK